MDKDKFEYVKVPITLENFDYLFYIKNNPDLKNAGVNGLIQCYQHWTTFGCFESRKVRSVKSDEIYTLKLKPNQRVSFTHARHHMVSMTKEKTHEKNHVKVIKNVPLPPRPIKTPSMTMTMNMPSLISLPQPPIVLKKHSVIKNQTPIEDTFTYQGSKIKLNMPIAILIHIFDINYLHFFIKNVEHLQKKYTPDSFHIFLNIVEEDVKTSKEQLSTIVSEHCSMLSKDTVVKVRYSENKGGDIGGFLLMCKDLTDTIDKYMAVIFVHSKTNKKWRYELCSAIFNFPFQTIKKSDSIGLISSNKWIKTIDPKVKDYDRFKAHLTSLFLAYDINDTKETWKFIGGTMFIANIQIIKYIISHNIDDIYMSLNKINSVDHNWLRIVTEELHLHPHGCGNDLQYRLKYGKPLRADYMIEHAYERIIGLICQHLSLKVKGV
jgi:hypothetical protein